MVPVNKSTAVVQIQASMDLGPEILPDGQTRLQSGDASPRL